MPYFFSHYTIRKQPLFYVAILDKIIYFFMIIHDFFAWGCFMFKRMLLGILYLVVITPLGIVSASSTTGDTNASITVNPGSLGFTQLITTSLFFQPYTIGATQPNQNNTSTHTFKVADYSGDLSGWTVSATFSDFSLDTNNDGVPEDRLSNHGATIDFKCGSTTFKSFTHACQTDVNRAITSSGTAPSILASSPANSTSAGEFVYTIPANFFALKFNNSVKEGNYNGTLTIDFASVYTP